MTSPADAPSHPALSHHFAENFPELSLAHTGRPTRAPHLLTLNAPLATELGLDPDWLATENGLRFLTGEAPGPDARPVAQGYAGHQFGGYSPVLGDGRALLLGELTTPDGRLTDLHLKGSGRTAYARPGADGMAAVGPMLREHVISEFLHAAGAPSTRTLAVVGTGDTIQRETPRPGAVLARTASSHLRVGSFQLAAALDHQRAHDDAAPARSLVARLVDEALARHEPGVDVSTLTDAERAETLLAGVIRRQAELVAQWMLLGFVHGVMNTDNMTISGESIDFGPCAFMEAFDLATVFSSIDRQGRYAYAQQPGIAQWNLTRFAETLLPLLSDVPDDAVASAETALREFRGHHSAAWSAGLRAKLGLGAPGTADVESEGRARKGVSDEQLGQLTDELFGLLAEHAVDWTSFWADLAEDVVPPGLQDWHARWAELDPVRAVMRRTNPRIIPRNHVLDAALESAEAGDLSEVQRILAAVADPYTAAAGDADLTRPASGTGRFVTYCGT
ncbi:MAG: protein adenylyltransferase SelO family protein [Micrococcus sp.]|nr:protein adenylyltransferase SelO family protein [Micrococcus sp.]